MEEGVGHRSSRGGEVLPDLGCRGMARIPRDVVVVVAVASL